MTPLLVNTSFPLVLGRNDPQLIGQYTQVGYRGYETEHETSMYA